MVKTAKTRLRASAVAFPLVVDLFLIPVRRLRRQGIVRFRERVL